MQQLVHQIRWSVAEGSFLFAAGCARKLAISGFRFAVVDGTPLCQSLIHCGPLSGQAAICLRQADLAWTQSRFADVATWLSVLARAMAKPSGPSNLDPPTTLVA